MAQPLRRRQCAVQRDDVPADKTLGKARFELRRQVDLGHQHQRLLASRERLRRGTQIDLGLAAAGGTVQQHGRCLAFGHQAVELLQHLGLLVAQWRQHRVCWHRSFATGGRHRWQRLGHAFDTTRELRVVQLAQLWRQHRQSHLANAALVVTRSELDQRAPTRVQRRQRRQGLRDGAQLSGCRAARRLGGSGRPHHARHLALAQGNTHQGSGRERTLTGVVERVGQPGVRRRLHRDPQDHDLSQSQTHDIYVTKLGAPSRIKRKSMIQNGF